MSDNTDFQTIKVYSIDGNTTETIQVSNVMEKSNISNRRSLTHVINIMRKMRATKSALAKDRGKVSGSTRKIRRQKGLGAARHGDERAPIFVGGGKSHGPINIKANYKINKKAKLNALKVSMDDKVIEDKLIIINSFSMNKPSTSYINKALNWINGKSLVISDFKENIHIQKSVRSIDSFKSLDINGINPMDVFYGNNIIMDKDTFKKVADRLKWTYRSI